MQEPSVTPRLVWDRRHFECVRHSGAFGRTMMMAPMPAAVETWLKVPSLVLVGCKKSFWNQEKGIAPGIFVLNASSKTIGESFTSLGNRISIKFLDWIPKAAAQSVVPTYDYYSEDFETLRELTRKNPSPYAFVGVELLIVVNEFIARWFCFGKRNLETAFWLARQRRGVLFSSPIKVLKDSMIFHAAFFDPTDAITYLSETMPIDGIFPPVAQVSRLPASIS